MMDVQDIPLSEIFEDEEFNCRGALSPMQVFDLVNNIREVGLQNPIHVQPYDKIEGKKYRIIAGYRRFKAHVVMGVEKIPAIIKDGLDESHAIAFNLSENLARVQLNVMQEANAIKKLVARGHGREAIGKLIGKTGAWVQIRINALSLPPEIQTEVAAGMVGQDHIKQLMTIKTKEGQLEAVRKIKEIKQRGEKKVVYVGQPKPTPSIQKKPRKPHDVAAMMEYMLDSIGPSLATRALAWVCGNLSDVELYREMEATGLKDYKAPSAMENSPYLNYLGANKKETESAVSST